MQDTPYTPGPPTERAAGPALRLPATLGPHRLTGVLGQGATSTVLAAIAPDGRRLAIKLLTLPRLLARFEREERLLKELAAEGGFVPLLERGDSQWGPYLVMPLLAGGTLGERLRRGPLPLEQATGLMVAVAGAIGRAHARGVVHRDLKPSNILLDEQGRALVADLGLGKHVGDAAGSAVLSRTGELRGTWGYCAPEQLADAKSAGPAADVFSLGAVLHECLAGQPAFARAATPVEMLEAAQKGLFEPLERLRPDLPARLVGLVRRSLDPDPLRRPVDGEAFQQELVAALAPPPARRALATPTLAAALLVLIGIGVAVGLMRRGGPVVEPVTAPPPPPSRPPGLWHRATGGDVRAKHWGMANGVAFSPDGTRCASCGIDGVVAEWDPATGAQRWLESDSDGNQPLNDVAFSRDGALVLTAGPRGLAGWSANGKVVLTRPGQELFSLATTPGERVVCGGQGRVIAWDLSREQPAWEVGLGSDPVVALAISPAGSTLVAVAAGGGELRMIDVVDGKSLGRANLAGRPLRLALNADGTRVAVASAGGQVIVRSLPDFVEVARLAPLDPRRELGEGNTRALAFLPSGELLVGGDDGLIHRVDWERGREPAPLLGHSGWVEDLALAPDGTRLLSCSNDQTVRLWDLAAGREVWAPRGHDSNVSFLAWSEDGRTAYSAGPDGTLRGWDPATMQETGTRLALTRRISGMALTPEGTQLVSAEEQLMEWDRRGERFLWERPIERSFSLLGRLPSGELLLGSWEGALLRVPRGSGGAGRPLAVTRGRGSTELSQDGRTVLFAGHELRLIATDGSGERSIPWTGGQPVCAALVGERVALGTMDSELLLLGQDGSRIELDRSGEPPAALAADRSGRWLASSQGKGRIRVWDLERRAQLGEHVVDDGSMALAFSPDGSALLVGTVRGLVVVLDVVR